MTHSLSQDTEIIDKRVLEKKKWPHYFLNTPTWFNRMTILISISFQKILTGSLVGPKDGDEICAKFLISLAPGMDHNCNTHVNSWDPEYFQLLSSQR